MKQFWILDFRFWIKLSDHKIIILLVVCTTLLAFCTVAEPQQPARVPRIGILRVGKPPDAFIDAFRQGLHDIGYIEGRNIVLDYRWMNGEDQLSEFSKELVRVNCDIIIATSTPAALAAKRATQSIPIVVPVMGNPIGSGLVMSLAHPGGNLTGLSNLAPELWPKRLELLKETVPKLSRIAMLWNKSNPAMAVGAKETQESASVMKNHSSG